MSKDRFHIGIDAPLPEHPEDWHTGQGSNLSFSASNVAADLAAALARAEALEFDRDTLRTMFAEADRKREKAEARLVAFDAAARATVRDAVTGPYRRCRVCSDVGQHDPGCPVGHLAALLPTDGGA